MAIRTAPGPRIRVGSRPDCTFHGKRAAHETRRSEDEEMKKEHTKPEEQEGEEELEQASGGIDTVPLPEMPRGHVSIGTWPTPERPALRPYSR